MNAASEQLFIFEQSAADRSAALLHKLDAGTSARVPCTEPGNAPEGVLSPPEPVVTPEPEPAPETP